MTPLISVVLAGATSLLTLAIAMTNGRLFSGHGWLIPYLFIASLLLYLLAGILAVIHWRKQHDGARVEDQLRFVLEVAGTPPLRSNTDWKFLLTNCGMRSARYVQLSTIRSEIGAYEICFKEIPVLQAGQKTAVDYEVIPRRSDDRYKGCRGTLWDFGMDNAGESGSTYFWYNISIQYRDTDESVRDGGTVRVCFDLQEEKLKTEWAEYYRQTP